MINKRGSGILLHITSLPSPFGIGDLGPSAYRFAQFLAEAGQGFWQVLPLNPTDLAFGSSPYSSNSAFAGNVNLISPELLVADGLLNRSKISHHPDYPADHCDFEHAVPNKIVLLNSAYEQFKKSNWEKSSFEGFCEYNSYWLENYALFAVLKRFFGGGVWSDWPEKLRDRDPSELYAIRLKFSEEINREKFLQYLFNKQWHLLKNYANEKGVEIIGDIPIYVSYDSVDVWENSEIFKLDQNKKTIAVAGVPPDYFSATGQLWGNPVYRWDVLKQNDYSWWMQRIEHNLSLFNIIRIDHFRGFVGFWEVPASEKTAINGKWVKVPAEDFFTKLIQRFPKLVLIAEDLGIITDDVKAIMKKFGFPGMKVLQFAFGEDLKTHPYLPHNYEKNCVVYTGTHDNNTIKGWFLHEARPEDKLRLNQYFGHTILAENVNWELIDLAMESIANLCIIPMQDVLGLTEEGRMNTPSMGHGNWAWRLKPNEMQGEIAKHFKMIVSKSGRDLSQVHLAKEK